MAGDGQTGGQRGSSQGQNLKTRRVHSETADERQEAEEGMGHTNAYTLNHSIIACLFVCVNVCCEFALAGSALKSALS